MGGVPGGLAGSGWGEVACAKATGAGSSAVQSAESSEKPSVRESPCSPVDPRSLWHQAPARPRGRRAKRQPLRLPAGSAEQHGASRSAAGSAFSTLWSRAKDRGHLSGREGRTELGAEACNLAVSGRRGRQQVRGFRYSLGESSAEASLTRNFI